MLCKVSKEDAAVLNALSDQAYNVLTGAIMSGQAIIGLASGSPCIKTSALVHGIMNQLMQAVLSHRQTHGELQDIKSLADLRKNPAAFQALANDINEILACVLGGIDPKHDYMLNLFQREKTEKEQEA